MEIPMWLHTFMTRFVAPEIPRNSPMTIWKAFVARFFAKSRMLMMTTQACHKERTQPDGHRNTRKNSTNLALVSLLAHASSFCFSERFREVTMRFRRNHSCGRVSV